MAARVIVISKDNNLCCALRETLNGQYELSHLLYSRDNLQNMQIETSAVLYIVEAEKFSLENKALIWQIKKTSNMVPILFLSRQSDSKKKVKEKVCAIESDVDEYLAYPQTIDEIIASMKALIRRTQRLSENKILLLKQEFVINPESRQIYLKGKEIPFTKLEFEIIYYLALNQERAVTYKELYEAVWHKEYLCDDMNIMAHIHRIRQKLEPDPKHPAFIQNVYGIGYRFAS